MGEMIANISHQWRQPLSVISTGATGMKMQKEYNVLIDDFFYTTCDSINENAQYLSQTIDDFTNFIRGDSKPVRFDLKNDTDSFIKLVDSTIKKHHLTIILELEESIKIKGYPNELIQCFINIFNNSKDALIENTNEDERFIFISQKVINNDVIIKFKDNAGGIPLDVLPKIFEPYFTTKHKSQGTGLGLHMSYNLITKSMKGEIKAENVSFEFNNKRYLGAQFNIKIQLKQH
jgi:signal transduction histidine kinase